MKRIALILIALGFTACTNVPAGSVGIKVHKYGQNKGVDNEVMNPGRYFLTWNEQMFIFPTFQQNYTWTKSPHEGSPNDESFTFQTEDGMTVSADVGISYHLLLAKIPTVFQKYREGVSELTNMQIRNVVRDALNETASGMSITELYGSKKNDFIATVKNRVSKDPTLDGIIVDNIYLAGSLRLPETIVAALNSKIEAVQRAQQRENEVAEARAAAQKEIATAQGDAQAALTRAEAEAKANILKQKSLTPELIKYETIQKWDGKLPQINGGSVMPMINFDHTK